MSSNIPLQERFLKCESGEKLNFLMHGFLFMTTVMSVAFIFFDQTASVQAFVLYQQTVQIDGAVNAWGIVGLVTMALHTLGFLIRGKVGVRMMQATIFGGAYLWLWASAILLVGGFPFQFLYLCAPNLWFWGWYAWQWRKRNRGDRVAFV